MIIQPGILGSVARYALIVSIMKMNHIAYFVHRTEFNGVHTNQFLSACFRNLTNAINSTYYQAFTMRNVWESVVSEA